MVKLADVLVERQGNDYISLNKLLGDKTVADVVGYVSDMGWGAFFRPSQIVLSDDTTIYLDGEHDTVFFEHLGRVPENLDDDTLKALYRERYPYAFDESSDD